MKVPQADPVHDVPEMLQVTPALLVSFVTLAVKGSVWPASMLVDADGDIATEMTFFLPPLPHPHRNTTTDNMIKRNFFMT